ncbi:MAG: choice-of-anchor B family protein [Bacteroidetes bacterium]|nr:MAG: choice-of-anchor B family protein [Bacteroidota bacterium]
MLKKLFPLIALVLHLGVSYAQLNLQQVGYLNYNALHGAENNDVWGYVDEFGNEYGLVGTTKGTSVVDLTDPSTPVEVFWEPGMESIWRDLKTFGDYAYVTTEAENGLLIIDLSPLPSSTALSTYYYTGPTGQEWQSAHNLWIDENGYVYIFGANRGNGGVIILDVATNPTAPIEVGVFDNWYVHDGFVRNDTMYLAHIEAGFLSVVDVADKANPILLGTKTTPNNFTHNIWPSDNGQFVFTTDEVSGAFLAAYDISDPLNIVEVDRIQSSPGQGVIPHNAHVYGNYLITSYYSDGVTIHDITHPHNIIEVGSYDTYPLQTTSYDGCWGAYPFLPSGLILATDITEGFFVLQPTYVQAAYLEGNITEVGSGTAINAVNVQISGNNQIDLSNSLGDYATGYVNGGTYNVTYSKVGYYPQTIPVTLTNGVIVIQDVQMTPIPPFNFTVNVVEAGTLAPISDAQILLQADLLDHNGITNGIGVEDFILYYQEDYNVLIGKWGYVTSCFSQNIDNTSGSITVELTKGYYDDFEFDFSWISTGSANTGNWERGIPNASSSGSAPGWDAAFDCGENAYVTGNDPNPNPDADDVDGGYVSLISPAMDLTGYSDPYLNFARWFYCFHGTPSLDSLKVIVTNGFVAAPILILGNNMDEWGQWITHSIRLSDYLPITSSMQVIFRTSDLDPDVNITEAGIDHFFISNASVLELTEDTKEEIRLYPNPFSNSLYIENIQSNQGILMDLNGKILSNYLFESSSIKLDLGHLNAGIYLLKIGEEVFKVIRE